ncbi:hypothetical protein PHYPSEUDO_006775 [Phytophthora pseudosyringae]|uniref:Reverse transcriptase n=1 Tax=Phytophthora pseudosyringae TaxID=221518 RepID=A0A8T1VN09_9STRA|nr:hypothetical protein PHYPSEUDO_006775 [Phytophthora pseudosyringae]
MTRSPEEEARSVTDTQMDGTLRRLEEEIEAKDSQEERLGSRSEDEKVVSPSEANPLSCDQDPDTGMSPDATDLCHDSIQDHHVGDDRPDQERKERPDQERIGPDRECIGLEDSSGDGSIFYPEGCDLLAEYVEGELVVLPELSANTTDEVTIEDIQV